MVYQVTLIPGDGIGPEVAFTSQACINATQVPIEWEIITPPNKSGDKKMDEALLETVIDSISRTKIGLKGPLTTPIGTGFRSINVKLRYSLDLYANIRPCRLYDGISSPFKHVDLVLIRENTEDLYAGIEYDSGAQETQELIAWVKENGGPQIPLDAAISFKPISATASERIIRFAFEYALKNSRKKVTAVHKANIMKATDGLFLKVFREISSKYNGKIEAKEQLVDSLCMNLVRSPELYDVLVLPNLYGDIVSDLCAGLIGGLGVAPGINLGEKIAIFEAVHGSAPQLAGQNKANPTAMILSGVLMLRYLDETKAADLLEWALLEVLREGKNVTLDLKSKKSNFPCVGTKEMGAAIIHKIKLQGKMLG